MSAKKKKPAPKKMCDCVDKMQKAMAEKYTTGERIRVAFTTNPMGREYPILETERYVGGVIKKSKITMIPTFCPWCGKKYPQ